MNNNIFGINIVEEKERKNWKEENAQNIHDTNMRYWRTICFGDNRQAKADFVIGLYWSGKLLDSSR